jgi:exopolysaccharide biosynthesis protein
MNKQFYIFGTLLFILCTQGLEMNALASRYGAQLKAIRFQPSLHNTQVILDLNTIPKDLRIQNHQNQGISATFKGELAPGLQANLKQLNLPNLQQVYWQKAGEEVQVYLKTQVADNTTYYPAHQPERIVFTIQNQVQGVIQTQQVAPGVTHTRLVRHSGRGPLNINVLEIDPKTPNLEIAPALASGKMAGKAKASTIAYNTRAIAAINGSFFKPDQGIPLGLLIINEELVAGPLFERVALGISSNAQLKMDRVGMRGNLIQGNTRVKLDNVNQPRTEKHQVVLYTSRWGATAPKVPSGGVQIQLLKGQITGVSTQQSLPIPKDGYVVSGPLTNNLRTLIEQAATPIQVGFYTTPDWSDVKHAISGGPFLLRSGQLYVDAAAQRFSFSGEGSYAPRSAAGITRSGKLLLVTVDGRQKSSVGTSLTEMAHIMKQLGAVDAMNLDGGSSTQMVVAGKLVNSPSVPNGVAVSNCLVVRQKMDITHQATKLNTEHLRGQLASRSNNIE